MNLQQNTNPLRTTWRFIAAHGTACLNEGKRSLAYTISPPGKVSGVNTSLTCLSHLSTSPLRHLLHPPPHPLIRLLAKGGSRGGERRGNSDRGGEGNFSGRITLILIAFRFLQFAFMSILFVSCISIIVCISIDEYNTCAKASSISCGNWPYHCYRLPI